MTWRVTSSTAPALRADLDVAGPDVFHRAGEAVRAFAERHEGTAYPLEPGSSFWRFFVPGATVLVFADVDADELVILRILPDTPLPAVTPLLDVPEDDEDE
jgi:hypothetical protein